MSFVLRRPFVVTAAFKPTVNNNVSVRFVHNSPFKQATRVSQHGNGLSARFSKTRRSFQDAFRRTYYQSAYQSSQGQGSLGRKLLYGSAIVGGTIVATNVIFNRETREDGGMAPYERSFLNDTFLHTGLGVGIIGITAKALHNSGWSYRLMATNPWVAIGVSLVASIGTMYGTFYTHPDKYVPKMIPGKEKD